jgi:hypothetical protein
MEEPDAVMRKDVADWLGVGYNMGKSIRYWLEVTGLSQPSEKEGRRTLALEASDLGRLIYEHDVYFAEAGTWWALHLELVNQMEQATSWAWFFNHFARSRFTKTEVLDALRRYLELNAQRRTPPSPQTLDRDVSCLLSSYARPIPEERTDPEEATECPFRDLGLLRYLRSSGVYQMDFERKGFSPEVLLYALSRAFDGEAPEEATHLEMTLGQAAGREGGAGRAFALTAEGVFEQAMRAEEAFPDDLEIGGLAGERILRLKKRPPLDWLRVYYRSLGVETENAA